MLRVVDSARPTEALSVDELGSQIVALAGRLAAATCRWLLLVARLDACEGCAAFGLASTARWLGHYCGLAHRTAVEHVRVARALAGFPELAAAMGAGRLSYSQVRAISRLAHDGEHRLVEDLIEAAGHGTAGHLETLVRGLRTVEDTNSDEQQRQEYVSHSWSSEAQWRIHARLDPEHGAIVQSAVETIARAEGISQAAALVRMAEIALATVADTEKPIRGLRGDERAAVVIHLTAADLPADTCADGAPPHTSQPRSAERTTDGPPRPYAHIVGGPGLPDSVVQRLTCAGRIRTARQKQDGTVLDLGRSHRVVSERLYRALLLRDDGCCTYPGCANTRDLEAHHVRHWLYGGPTNLANLVLLCAGHHRAHHDGEFRIQPLGRCRFRFRRADGRVLPHHVDPGQLTQDPTPVENEHADIPADAATTRWIGDRLDRHYAISVLAQHRKQPAPRAS
ncbi:MAG TPA: DUF222 domain-containing protein [Mycobacterium sp.]|nr:DUF222 domain-containing protein [Mycobacterium sp.]